MMRFARKVLNKWTGFGDSAHHQVHHGNRKLLFLPSVYAPCSACHGARYNAQTLEVVCKEKNVAEVLGLSVDAACDFFADVPPVLISLEALRQIGLGYLRLGQPATELSGGEAQRIKLAGHVHSSTEKALNKIMDLRSHRQN